MRQPPDPPVDPGIAAVEDVVRRINRRAAAIATALGAPPEAKYAVLAALGEQIVPVIATPDEEIAATPVAQPTPTQASDDVRVRLHDLIDGFLRTHAPEHLQSFRGLWEVIKTTPIDLLGQRLVPRPSGPTGVGFASSERSLGVVISVTSWALSQQLAATGNATSGLSEDVIAGEAQVRGCPRGLSYALAAYLGPRLSAV